MTEPAYSYDLFISYAHADEEHAKKIKKRLESLCTEIKIFLSPESVNPGENFIGRIDDALSKARYFLVLLSPESVKADWPVAERTAALLKDPAGRLGRVIPIIIKDCELSPLLSIRQWIDLRKQSNFEGGMERLARWISGKPIPGQDATKQCSSSKAPPANLYGRSSYEPDTITEVLYTNLYKAEKLPTITRAFTRFPKMQDVVDRTKCTFHDFDVSNGSLYTLQDLETHESALKTAIDPSSAEKVPDSFWFENEDNERLLTRLLNRQAYRLCEARGLSYDRVGKRYYANMSKTGLKKFRWVSHVRNSQRAMIIPYPKDGPVRFCRHRSIKPSFRILGTGVFLQLRPGWTFTWDGYECIDDEKRRKTLNVHIQSRTRNDAQFAEQRFWAWLLSDGSAIKMGYGNNALSINLEPLNMTSRTGICGDHLPASFKQAEPPALASNEDDVILEEADAD